MNSPLRIVRRTAGTLLLLLILTGTPVYAEPLLPSVSLESVYIPSVKNFSLSIPSIGLETTIVPVGLNDKGEMDVPDGSSQNVGWWSGGVVPGAVGSAVLDAHVFAAFKNLNKVNPGDILVVTRGGETFQFRVEATEVTALERTSAEKIFNQRDTARLTLITCAGTYIPSRQTYDHRLVVYAVLIPTL